MRYLILIPLWACTVLAASAQKDTLFWFVAPEATINHGESPVVVRMSAGATGANVVIDQPANPGFAPMPVSIPAGTGQTVDLTAFLASLENIPADAVLDKGLRIRSNTFISAYYEVNTACNCNPEIYALKGKNALGTSFLVPFQTIWDNGTYPNPANSAIDIVATEDNTVVTITPANAVTGHAAGVPYTINLNKGQTYSARQANTLAAGNLSGTVIVSNKKIAVTIKDDSLGFQGCQDLAGDQIVPVNVIGKEYIVVKGSLNVTDKVFVLPTQNGTNISVNGTSQGTFNAAQSFQYDLTANSMYIQSDKPVYVLHYTGFGCEIGSALVPPLKCTGSNNVYVVRSTAEYFGILLFTRTANVGNFQVNGNASLITAANFSTVPGTGGAYSSALVAFSTTDIPAGSSVTVENSSGLFHMGILNGGASSGCRYGFFSDFSGQIFSAQITQQISCPGADDGALDLEVMGGLLPYTYQWSNGDTTQDITGLTDGWYTVIVTDASGCTDSSSFQVAEPVPINLQFGPITDVTCFGGSDGSISVIPGGGTQPYQYLWNNGDTTSVITDLAAGNYGVVFTDINGCDTLRMDTAITQPPPVPLAVSVSDSVLCIGDIANLIASGANSYVWSPVTGLSSNTGIAVNASYSSAGSITYQLKGTDGSGCMDSLQFTILTHPYTGPDGPFVVDPSCFGVVDFKLDGVNNETLDWDFGDGNTGTGTPIQHIYQQAGNYTGLLSITDANGCDTVLSQPLQVAASLTFDQVQVPNVISPDGNSINDEMVLDPAFDECNDYKIQIMNRWGLKIYEGHKGDEPFRGKSPFGGKLSPGVYFYVMEVNGKFKNGTITVLY